jgi:hypothetical protein
VAGTGFAFVKYWIARSAFPDSGSGLILGGILVFSSALGLDLLFALIVTKTDHNSIDWFFEPSPF